MVVHALDRYEDRHFCEYVDGGGIPDRELVAFVDLDPILVRDAPKERSLARMLVAQRTRGTGTS